MFAFSLTLIKYIVYELQRCGVRDVQSRPTLYVPIITSLNTKPSPLTFWVSGSFYVPSGPSLKSLLMNNYHHQTLTVYHHHITMSQRQQDDDDTTSHFTIQRRQLTTLPRHADCGRHPHPISTLHHLTTTIMPPFFIYFNDDTCHARCTATRKDTTSKSHLNKRPPFFYSLFISTMTPATLKRLWLNTQEKGPNDGKFFLFFSFSLPLYRDCHGYRKPRGKLTG